MSTCLIAGLFLFWPILTFFFVSTAFVQIKVTDYSSSSEESESSDEDGETVGHDGTVAVSDIPRIM